MKCKICGHRANSLPAMSAHYRKKHPNRMKERTHKRRVAKAAVYEDAHSRVENALIAFVERYNRGERLSRD